MLELQSNANITLTIQHVYFVHMKKFYCEFQCSVSLAVSCIIRVAQDGSSGCCNEICFMCVLFLWPWPRLQIRVLYISTQITQKNDKEKVQ